MWEIERTSERKVLKGSRGQNFGGGVEGSEVSTETKHQLLLLSSVVYLRKGSRSGVQTDGGDVEVGTSRTHVGRYQDSKSDSVGPWTDRGHESGRKRWDVERLLPSLFWYKCQYRVN